MCSKVLICVVLCLMCIWHKGYSQPCPLDLTINIDNGTVLKNGNILHDDVTYAENEYFLYNETEYRGCVCLKKSCLRKCCPEGQILHSFMEKSSCTVSDRVFEPPTRDGKNTSDAFHIIYGMRCASYALEEDYVLNSDGSFYHPEATHYKEEHCIENRLHVESGQWKYVVLECFEVEDAAGAETTQSLFRNQITNYLLSTGFLISSVFLMATFCVYAFVSELRNTHGKCLMNYVLCLSISFFLIATLKIMTSEVVNIPLALCESFTLIAYFFFMGSFFWMNAMCVDIYLTFSRDVRMPAFVENRRFLYYFIYAWGSSSVLTAICMALQFHPNTPSHIVPIAQSKCWFADEELEKFHIYIPLSILVTCNIILFTITSLKILKIRRETSVLREGGNRSSRQRNEEQRFILYVKLFLVMGINWLAEIVSYFVGGSVYTWIVPDFLNTILGVYIFFIFVWKQRVRILIKKRVQSTRRGTKNNSKTSNVFGQESKSSYSTDNNSSITEAYTLKNVETSNGF